MSGKLTTASADRALAHIAERGLTLAYVLETHAHADHLSAGHLIRERTGAKLVIGALHTPGHTPACVTYRIGDAAFVGDTLFMPDYGTARADFPGGDAATLYRSIQRILALPPETRLFVGHDYLPAGRSDYRFETSVAAERAGNIHVHSGVTEADFVAMRTQRDATLAAPTPLLPSLQVNIRGGALPEASAKGRVFFKLPVTLA